MNKLTPLTESTDVYSFDGNYTLGIYGKEFEEFKDLSSHIKEKQELVRLEKMPSAAQNLLNIMSCDVWQFYRLICPSDSQDVEMLFPNYHVEPIFKYINPSTFVEKLITMNPEAQRSVFWGLSKRYELVDIQPKLIEELEWLKSVQTLLQEEVEKR